MSNYCRPNIELVSVAVELAGLLAPTCRRRKKTRELDGGMLKLIIQVELPFRQTFRSAGI
jgi:hypothetical protein